MYDYLIQQIIIKNKWHWTYNLILNKIIIITMNYNYSLSKPNLKFSLFINIAYLSLLTLCGFGNSFFFAIWTNN